MIVVIDYHKGNLKSVERGLATAGAQVQVSDNPDVIAQAAGLVLPGVGSFADAAAAMCALGQTDVVRSRILKGCPFLGICLGLHLLFEQGTETSASFGGDQAAVHPSEHASGLGILPGVVDRLPRVGADGKNYKVPHVGWNTIEAARGQDFSTPLLEGIHPGEYFYFTHSYVAPNSDANCAVTEHSVIFPSVVQYRESAFGVQFHPEKSSDAGIAVLKNFVHIVREA